MKLLGVAPLLALVACISPSSVTCSDGTVCPAGTTCEALSDPSETICATPTQLAACDGVAEGAACATGWCHDNVCLPIVCGNGRVDLGEACDDGNTITGDGTCSGDCSSNETCGNGLVDPLKIVNGVKIANEQCDDGNAISGDGCSSQCLNETPIWEQLDAQPIPALAESSATYDPGRNRVVLFGGFQIPTPGGDDVANSTVYEWNGKTWFAVPSTLAPGARQSPGLAYDGVNRRVVLFGGHLGDDTAPVGDTWEWDGAAWTLMSPASSPSPRTELGMAYDAARKKVVLFGGFGQPNGAIADTWEWDGSTWTQVMTAHVPARRYQHKLIYDPKRGKIVMVGGTTSDDVSYPNDTWEYDGTDWTQINIATPVELHGQFMMAYDTSSSRIIAYGGDIATPNTPAMKTYAFDGSTWTDLGLSTPGPRERAVMAANPTDGTLVMFGGIDNSNAPISTTNVWKNNSWTVPAAVSSPGPRFLAAVGIDPRHGLAWLFGGKNAAGNPTNDLWSFDGVMWTAHPFVGGPPAQYATGLAYDQAHDQLVAFGGGVDQPIATGGTATLGQQTWLWNGQSWTLATPPTSPPARYGPSMTYDVTRGRVVMFGGGVGYTGFGPPPALADTWEWDGTTWTQNTSAGPTARLAAGMTFDPIRNDTVLFGGFIFPNPTNDLWSYDGATWTDASPSSPLPPRLFPGFGYDPALRASVLFAGLSLGGESYDDTWKWDGQVWQQLITEVTPSPRAGPVTFPDPSGTGIMLYGGATKFDNNSALSELWRFRFASATPREICGLDIDNDGDGKLGCDDPDCWATCTPLCAPGAVCPATAPRCGDGTCDPLETCRNCAMDCGQCTAACGDTFCDPPESIATCPGDCSP